MSNADIQDKLKSLDTSIHQKIGDYTKSFISGAAIVGDNAYLNIFIDDDNPHPDEAREPFEDLEIPDSDGDKFKESLAEELEDRYIGIKVLLPQTGK